MFELSITPELLVSIVAVILAVAFDWFPKLAPWYDTLSELKKKQLMGGLLFVTVGAVYGGICVNLFSSASYSCTQVSLAELVKVAFLAIMANQAVHALTKPTQLYRLTHSPDQELTKGQGMVEYALILVLVAVIVIAALTIMGPLVANVFSTINENL
jgi:pilus assembly protein Flp/PilA